MPETTWTDCGVTYKVEMQKLGAWATAVVDKSAIWSGGDNARHIVEAQMERELDHVLSGNSEASRPRPDPSALLPSMIHAWLRY